MHIEGLSKQDVLICDLLWNCASAEAVDRMIEAMPEEHKQRALVLKELLVATALDEVMEIRADVKEYIDSIAGS